MNYEVVVFDEKSSSNGVVLKIGSLKACCDYAQLYSRSSCLNLLVRPFVESYLFVNGEKADV